MTMQSMVNYLEARGFKAIKEYVPKTRSYRFEIERNGKHLIKHFTYQYGPQSWRFQEMFLDDMVNEFEKYEKKEKEKEMANDIEWKVDNITVDRRFGEADTFKAEIVGRMNGVVVSDYADIANGLQKKLNAPERKDEMDAWTYVMAGGRQNGKTLTQMKIYYERMFGINLDRVLPKIEKVIFNNPATIVIWADDTKTVVKAQNDELFDPEKGLAMAITKKALGNEGNYFDTIKKHVTEYQDSVAVKKLTVDISASSGFKDAMDVLQKAAAIRVVPAIRKESVNARNTLEAVLDNKKATKAELIEAIERAQRYLNKGLDS